MNDFVTLPPAERCARILRGVHRALVFQGLGSILGWPLLTLLSHRLCAAAAHILAIAARLQAGTLRLPPPREHLRRSRKATPPVADAETSEKLHLPRGFAWLLHRVRGISFGRSQLTHLVHQPDMVDLIAAAPPIAHHLRPICRMLGVKPPPGLFPPRRPRRKPAPKSAPPPARRRQPASRKPPATPSRAPVLALALAPPPHRPAPPRKPPAIAAGPPKPSA